jgi:hypothetical protein
MQFIEECVDGQKLGDALLGLCPDLALVLR